MSAESYLPGPILGQNQELLSLRSARLSDISKLHGILRASVVDPDSGYIFAKEIDEILAFIEDSVDGQNDGGFIVAESSAAGVVGLMGLRTAGQTMRPFGETDNPGELINAHVLPRERGSGIGRLLAAGIERRARDRGFSEIVLNSGIRYEKTGWPFWTKLYGQPVGQAKNYYGFGAHAQVWRKSLERPKN